MPEQSLQDRRSALATFVWVAAGLIAISPQALAYQSKSTAAINLDKQGLALGGYDPVAYFTLGKATIGKAEFSAVHDGATYRFLSAAHRDAFLAEPARYLPQYGGYCAYAAAQGYKANADATAWHVVDGRLFVNYNQWVARSWAAKAPEYIKTGDSNWSRVRSLPAQ
jgi:YHS domain-containing protein